MRGTRPGIKQSALGWVQVHARLHRCVCCTARLLPQPLQWPLPAGPAARPPRRAFGCWDAIAGTPGCPATGTKKRTFGAARRQPTPPSRALGWRNAAHRLTRWEEVAVQLPLPQRRQKIALVRPPHSAQQLHPRHLIRRRRRRRRRRLCGVCAARASRARGHAGAGRGGRCAQARVVACGRRSNT